MKLWDKVHSSGLVLERIEQDDSVVMPAPYVQRSDEFYAEWKAQRPDPEVPEETSESLTQKIDEKNKTIAELQKEVESLQATLEALPGGEVIVG